MSLRIKPWVIDPTGASEGDVMALVNGIFQFQAPSGGGADEGARVFKDSNTTIANNTVTDLAFNQEQYDTDTIHSTVANTSRLTCKTAGRYVITASVLWAANANGGRRVQFWVNATTYIAGAAYFPNAAVSEYVGCTTVYELAVNDYVECRVYQTSGGPLDIIYFADASPYFAMERVAPASS